MSPSPLLPAPTVAALREALCAWFEEHRRDLPWRRTSDPYAIWISEAMLQQTRVETVIPYYERFLARFPDPAALARASEDDVVAAWSGLGYYRRARALRTAAIEIVERFGGAFPDSAEDVLALPGVGPYTAGAVLSIAFGRSRALVDGNVTRVFSRLFEVDAPVGTTRARKAFWALAECLVPPAEAPPGRGPGDWNQAVMELGALVCTSRSPDCERCPLATRCGARAAGRVDELPVPAKKRAPIDVTLEVVVALRGDEVLLARRPSGGRMARMWELPTRQLAPESGPGADLWPRELAQPATLRPGADLVELSHGITHHRIRALARRGVVEGELETARDGWRWFAVEEAGELALTGLTRKVLASDAFAAQRGAPFPM